MSLDTKSLVIELRFTRSPDPTYVESFARGGMILTNSINSAFQVHPGVDREAYTEAILRRLEKVKANTNEVAVRIIDRSQV